MLPSTSQVRMQPVGMNAGRLVEVVDFSSCRGSHELGPLGPSTDQDAATAAAETLRAAKIAALQVKTAIHQQQRESALQHRC